MRIYDLVIIITFINIIFFTIMFYNRTVFQNTEMTKYIYEDLIDLSLYSVGMYMNYNFDEISLNNFADGKIYETVSNKELVLEKFLKLIDLNFNWDYNKRITNDNIPIFMVIENDGLYVSESNLNNRNWRKKEYYVLNIEDEKYVKFKLNGEYDVYDENNNKIDYVINNEYIHEYRKIAIINTIKKQFVFKSRISKNYELNIPYDDTYLYNTIKNKSIIVAFTDLPLYNGKYDIVKISGIEVSEKNKYTINNNYYEKTNNNNYEFDSAYEAAENYYLPVI